MQRNGKNVGGSLIPPRGFIYMVLGLEEVARVGLPNGTWMIAGATAYCWTNFLDYSAFFFILK